MYCIGFPFNSCCLPSSFCCDGPCGPCPSPAPACCGPCGPGSCSCGGPCNGCLAPCGPCCSPCGGPRRTACEPLSQSIPAVSCGFIYRHAKFDHDLRLRNSGFYD